MRALDIEIPEIVQLGIVVEDIEDAMEQYRMILGVEPWTVYRFEPPDLTDTTYRGESVEYSMLIAHGYAGETDIELIEPLSGPNVYSDHLDERGEGVHHIKAAWEDEARTYEVVEEFEDAGFPVVQSGRYLGSEFFYFDTSEELHGLSFETSIRRNEEERTPEFVYP